ncbi:MAG: TrkH family potassium uptake protein [Clostridiales bacterium]|nr:TrkH family potassium uptake protein [Clostridiales bacterium]
MNGRMVLFLIGQMLRVEGLLMLLPLICAGIYGDSLVPFLLPIVLLCGIGTALTIRSPKKRDFSAKEGFVTVGLSWILLSLFGSIPLYISGYGISFIDCFFETVSGFTTTGATILGETVSIAALSKSVLFWRSFTHWIGGMGVLVFMLAVMPKSEMKNVRLLHVLRAEATGPSVSKISEKLKKTARILYSLYIALTVLQILFLLVGGMGLYDSLVNSFATAGTGGFSIKDLSIGEYQNPYFEYVIAVFMVLFSVNFNIFYLILCGHALKAFKSEELRWLFCIIAGAIAIIMIDIYSLYGSLEEVFRLSFFQVASIVSTTGFATADFNLWPPLSKLILVLLMFIGGCAGSTAGGIKIGRIIMLVKNGIREIRYILHPRSVISVQYEGRKADHETVRSTTSFLIVYILIFVVSILVITAVDEFDLVTSFTSVSACLNNVGPGLEMVGPMGNFAAFSLPSKLLLCFDMLAGRLEIFPIIMLISPSTWKRS